MLLRPFDLRNICFIGNVQHMMMSIPNSIIINDEQEQQENKREYKHEKNGCIRAVGKTLMLIYL